MREILLLPVVGRKGIMMVNRLWHIIRQMLDFYRRVWQASFAGFLVAVGLSIQAIIYLKGSWYMLLLAIPLLIVSLICLVVALIGLRYDYRDARRRDKPREHHIDIIR